MRKFWKIAGIVLLVAILGAGTTAAIVLAQGSKDGTTSPWDFRAKLREAIAGALGITVEKYDATIQEAQQKVLDEAVKEGWLTQEQADKMAERLGDGSGDGLGPGWGHGGPGKGFMGPEMGWMGGREDSLVTVAADKLGMTEQDLMTELQNGKTIADVAKEKSVDVQTILDAYATQLKATLDQAVAAGKIAQKMADWTLEQAKTRAAEQVNATWQNMGRGRGFMGPDMYGQETSLVAVAADKLGMTEQDLMTELRNGKTIADVAKEKSVDVQTILDAYATQLKATLDKAVADGKITQTVADSTLEQAKTRAADQVNNAWKNMGPNDFGKGGRPGRMWNNQDQNGL